MLDTLVRNVIKQRLRMVLNAHSPIFALGIRLGMILLIMTHKPQRVISGGPVRLIVNRSRGVFARRIVAILLMPNMKATLERATYDVYERQLNRKYAPIYS